MRGLPRSAGLLTSILVLTVSASCAVAQTDSAPPSPTPTFSGISGLIRVPTAEILPNGWVRLSWTSPQRPLDPSLVQRCSSSLSMTFMPRTEISLSLGSQSQEYDLIAHGKFLAVQGSEKMPAIAVGVTDVARNRPHGTSVYAVATMPFLDNKVALTLGGVVGGVDGVLAGIRYSPIPHFDLQAEYDGRRVNVGAVGRVNDRAYVRIADVSSGTVVTAGYTFPAASRTASAPAQSGVGPGSGSAQEAANKVLDELVEAGFEDVQVAELNAGAGLAVSYDNRLYTVDDADGIRAVLTALARSAPAGVSTLVARVRRRGVVVAEVEAPAGAYREFLSGKSSGAGPGYAVRLLPGSKGSATTWATPVANSSAGNVDFVVSPGIRSIIGTEDAAIKLGLVGRVEAVVPLGRGLQAQTRFAYPIGGQLVRDQDKRWVNDRALVSYALSPAPGWLAQVTVGRFPRANDGGTLEVVRPLSSHDLLRFTGGLLRDGLLDKRPYLLGEYWRMLPRWNAQVRVVGGRFLSADTGGGIDLVRFFGETEVTLGARQTSRNRLALLGISIPLSPSKQWSKPSAARVRLSDTVDHVSRSVMRGLNYLYLEDYVARELSLGPDLRTSFMNKFRLMPGSGSWPGL